MSGRYAELLRSLEQQARRMERDGYHFVEKPIPDSAARGEFDPRIHEVRRRSPHAPQEEGSPQSEPEQLDAVALALKMRAGMGWDNEDVTDGQVAVRQLDIAGRNGAIPIRIYTPPGPARPRPAIVFFHGGGFIGGTVDVVENPCKCLALHADAIVVNVDYRLAPENRYPAGLHDCFDAVRWVRDHAVNIGADADSIAVAGDSAGGNLATACALMDRDLGTGLIRFQALVYPTVSPAGIQTEDFKWSLDEYELQRDRDEIKEDLAGMEGRLEMLMSVYTNDRTEWLDPYVCPILADLSGLPETLIVTAEFDYLRLEAEAYARKLVRAGTKVKLIQYNGTDHAFVDKFALYPQAEDCILELAASVKQFFAKN